MMRWLTGWILLLGTLLLGGRLSSALRAPMIEGWRVVADAGAPQRPVASDLVALLLGGCAAMLALASAWLVLAVAACTWDVLVHGATRPSGPSLLRPPLVRACVAACVGATVLGSPAARAQSPPEPDGDRRHRVVPAATGPGAGPFPAPISVRPSTSARLLEGLPVPDRTTGPMGARTPEATRPARRHPRTPESVRLATDERRLEVRPGDSLWSLTAGMVPRNASEADVATGWRLLYAANRAVIGDDPDLLRPGQSLRVPPDLLDHNHSPSHSPDRRSR